jgi:pimeloyl-ACP methyl ester carboxylesterase
VSTVVLIHGNPGSPGDLARVADRLAGRGIRVAAPAMPSLAESPGEIVAFLETSVRDGEEPPVLVGYSWGAWAALWYVLRAHRAPSAVVLVNPYLVVTDRLSPVVAGVAALPGVGRTVLSWTAARLTRRFLDETFHPVWPSAPIARARAARLASPAVWQAAIRRKRLQQAAPLPPFRSLPCPVDVVVGLADRVAPWREHRAPLHDASPAPGIHAVPGAGHALPWTCPDVIASRIEARTPQEETS